MTGETRNTFVQVNDQTPVMYSFDPNGGYSGNNLALKSVVMIMIIILSSIQEITTGIVNIKAGTYFNHGDLRIVNISGQIIFENNNLKLEKEETYSFDLKNFPNAVYFLMLNSSAGVFSKKIIKQ